MLIGGFQKFSLIDYPGKTAAIIFTQGCNFKCPYCHNPELVDPSFYATPLSEENITDFLKARSGRLQGVSISGGEPTIQKDLALFLKGIKSLGYSVKLDTNGSNPEMLQKIIREGLADFIAMDVKSPFLSYEKIVRTSVDIGAIQKSIQLIISSDIEHEFRTTYFSPLLGAREMEGIAEHIRGCKKWVIQSFMPSKTLDPSALFFGPTTPEVMRGIASHLAAKGIECETR
jgi:pyruvate formate lyase activating enzyme